MKRKHLEALICEVSPYITREMLRKAELSKERLLDLLQAQLYCRMIEKRRAAIADEMDLTEIPDLPIKADNFTNAA